MVCFPRMALSQNLDYGEVNETSEELVLNAKFEGVPKNSVIKRNNI